MMRIFVYLCIGNMHIGASTILFIIIQSNIDEVMIIENFLALNNYVVNPLHV